MKQSEPGLSAAQPPGLVLDCDGVLVDSEGLASRVEAEVLRDLGLTLTVDEAHEMFLGKTVAGVLLRIEASTREHAESLHDALTHFPNSVVQVDGCYQIELTPDNEVTTRLVELVDTVGAWLGAMQIGMCQIHFGDRSLALVAPSDGNKADPTQFLVERARHRATVKAGGGRQKLSLDEAMAPASEQPEVDLIALDELIDELAEHDPQAAELVKLRCFAGFGHVEAADALGIERRAADRLWLLARSWLYRRLSES